MCLKTNVTSTNIYFVTSLLTERVQLHIAHRTHHLNQINQEALYLFNVIRSAQGKTLLQFAPLQRR